MNTVVTSVPLARAVCFAVLLPTLLVAHNVADHWVQTHDQAVSKGLPGGTGRLACALHVTGYTIVTTLAVWLVWGLFDLPLNPVGAVAGQLVSAVTHYWADRRTTLAWLARKAGKGTFYRLGAPRDGRDDNPSLGTGAYALDQSWHWAWLFAAALITALTAGGTA
ncbi:transcriptional regulator [Pseudonocardia acaciae]|uniref:transcriptional regulator n=1 Tax=Pseudonocardia acaciae TaxID=551276 RepID=UPI000A518D09|nr:transcriptional regulator [Pseudonocardia acaciae]